MRRVLVNYESVRRQPTEAFGSDLPIQRVAYASEAAFVHGEEDPLGPEPAAIAALEPRDAPLVVTVARHDPRKGIDVLLRALARLRAAQVPFRACLVGGWSLLDDHRRLAADLGLGRETVLTGFVPDAYPYLQHADVFVLPSLQEGSGSLALLEALQAGAPVVASAVDGIPEDVKDGEDGLLVPPRRFRRAGGGAGQAIARPGATGVPGPCGARYIQEALLGGGDDHGPARPVRGGGFRVAAGRLTAITGRTSGIVRSLGSGDAMKVFNNYAAAALIGRRSTGARRGGRTTEGGRNV